MVDFLDSGISGTGSALPPGADRKTEMIRKDSVEELCGHRARALELYAQGVALLVEAHQTHGRACIGNPVISHLDSDALKYGLGKDTVAKFAAEMRLRVDRDMWRALIVNTPLGSLMDRQERDKLESSLKDNPPEATPENIFATMSRLLGEADSIFRRGLVNAFRNLNRDYQSHDGFKIGDRIVLNYIVDCNEWSDHFNHRREEELRDVDRVFHILDGKEAPGYQQGLCAAMRARMGDRRKLGADYQREVETPYMRVRWFKNGNAHLWFTRPGLVERANKLIAEHYGETLGARPGVADRGYCPPPATPAGVSPDFFPTPAALAWRVVALANIQPGERVLEPSAGDGALCKFALARKARVDAIERSAERAAILRTTVFQDEPWRVLEEDFLAVPVVGSYDAVVMNPPWSSGQWAMHLLHAAKFLKPGGRLVAIVPPTIRSRATASAEAVRDLIEKWGGRVTDLAPGAFRESGTEVGAVVVVAVRPF